jgi:hypothetical protein
VRLLVVAVEQLSIHLLLAVLKHAYELFVLLLVAVQLVSEETVGVEGVVQSQIVCKLSLVAVHAEEFLGVVVVLRDAQQNPVERQRLVLFARHFLF